MRTKTLVLCTFGSLAVHLAGCSGSDGGAGSAGPNGSRTVVRASDEAAGTNCPNGGTMLEYGLDADADDLLDPAEVSGTEFVCNGPDGENAEDGTNGADGSNADDGGLTAVSVTAEPPGENCPGGGSRIEIGGDADADGEPDADATQSVSYVCDSTDAEDGEALLVTTAPESPGENCVEGGTGVSFGLDTDADGSLDVGEILGTSYVCDGDLNGNGSRGLVQVTPESAGTNCPTGGDRIDYGQDVNENGELDAAEIAGTRYVCRGLPGENGAVVLVTVSDEGPLEGGCFSGGQRVDSGLDLDDDQTLDVGEITETRRVCNGVDGGDGSVALVEAIAEPPGASCASGGQRLDSGFDEDGDAVLDPSEVSRTDYICAGDDGEDGSDAIEGRTGLVRATPEPAGANCASGGQRLQTGIDTDGNRSLDPGEVTDTDFVCDGNAGTDGVDHVMSMASEPAGANCAAGGQRVTTGLDTDRDGVLDAGEVTRTRFACNAAAGENGAAGTDARRSLLAVAAEPAGGNCAAGGQRVTWGVDDDNDVVLDAGEVDGTRFVCNGLDSSSDGVNAHRGLVSVTTEPIGTNCLGGGQRIDVGMDDDDDVILDADEIDSTSFVCDFAAIINGSFETGTYFGWTLVETAANDANGTWALLANDTTVSNGNQLLDHQDGVNENISSTHLPFTYFASDGQFLSALFQTGPDRHRMFQDVTVPPAATTLRWDMYYNNTLGAFDANNQYIAVNFRDVGTDAVLSTLFKTASPQPLSLPGMTAFSVDVTAFQGQDVRLDFEAQVQISWFPAAFDNIRFE